MFPFFIENVILPCYPGLQKETVRDPTTGRKIKGPLFIKTDTGPGRLSNELNHINYREQLMERGAHIGLGLPNGTECTQEMDQGYAQFKPACFESTLRVAAKKMAARVTARKKMKDQVKQSTTDKNLIQQSNNEKNTSVDELKEFLDNEGKEGNVDDEPCKNFSFEVKGSHCNVKLDNNDLSAIVNGYPDDPIELRPFNKIFTC